MTLPEGFVPPDNPNYLPLCSDEEKEALFLRQFQLEVLMNELGIDIYTKAHEENELRAYASHTDYGIVARKQILERCAEELRKRALRVQKGKPGVDVEVIHPYVNSLPYEKLAHIVLSTLLDCAGVPKKGYQFFGKEAIRRAQRLFLTNVHRTIGQRIENECYLLKIKGNFRNVYNRLRAEFFTQHSGYEQKMYRMRREVKSREEYFHKIAAGDKASEVFIGPEGRKKAGEIAELHHWDKWSDEVKVKLGAWCARCINEITGWFAETDGLMSKYQDPRNQKKRRTVKLLVFSKAFDQFRFEYMEAAKNYTYFHLPMIIPPKPHTEEEAGGYWFGGAVTDASQLVRGRNPKTVVGKTTLDFLNSQQQVGFKRNQLMYDVLKFMADKGWKIGQNDAYRPYQRGNPPELTQAIKDVQIIRPGSKAFKTLSVANQDLHRCYWNDMRRQKEAITNWHNSQAELQQLGVPARRFQFLLEKFPEEEIFYFPWSLDWRTRCYPVVDACHTQGPEFMKAFISFATEHPLEKPSKSTKGSEFWLANGLGVAAGLSKESYESRVTWVTRPENRERVIATATDPLGSGWNVWTNMDEPWFFLSLSFEYYQCYILKADQTVEVDLGEVTRTLSKKYTTSVLTGHDATCSGLQLLGGMVKDQTTCDMVNCTGGHLKPQDAYGAVLERTLELISEEQTTFPVDRLRGLRGLVKPAVMTLPYGAGHDTRVRQITEKLRELDIRLGKSDERNDERIEYFTKRVEDAMMLVIPGAYRILNWFQRVARQAYDNGLQDLEIETASGNVIVSSYHKTETKQVNTETLGQAVFTKARKRNENPNRRHKTEVNQLKVHDDSKPEGTADIESGVLGIGANLTHGAGDACLLQLAFRDADFDYTTTHDCVYCPATSIADEVHRRVRLAFVELCAFPTLQRFAERNGVEDIPPPITGDYKPEDVLKAQYFFC